MMELRKQVLAATITAGSLLSPALFEADSVMAQPLDQTAKICEYVIPPNTGSWNFEQTTGVDIGVVTAYAHKSEAKLFAQTSFNYPCDTTSPTEPNSQPQSNTAASKSCTFVVNAGMSAAAIEKSAGATISQIAAEMGVKKSVVTQANKVLDICIGNGKHDEKPNTATQSGSNLSSDSVESSIKLPNRPFSCGSIAGKCVEILRINGQNHTLLVNNGKVVLDTISNTGMEGMRSRNGNFAIMNTPGSNADYWLPRLITKDAQAADPTLLPRMLEIAHKYKLYYAPTTNAWMGDPKFFSGGQALHFRVNSIENSPLSSMVQVSDGKGGKKSVHARLFNPNAQDIAGVEKNMYFGGYASHGCDHVASKVLEDALYKSYFTAGTPIKVNDQPAN